MFRIKADFQGNLRTKLGWVAGYNSIILPTIRWTS
jgi:hypothetical protein